VRIQSEETRLNYWHDDAWDLHQRTAARRHSQEWLCYWKTGSASDVKFIRQQKLQKFAEGAASVAVFVF
jgi:hypothetical protein